MTPDHGRQATQSQQREQTVMRKNPAVTRIVQKDAKAYGANHRAAARQRGQRINGYYARYRQAYAGWERYGFRGGFAYAFRPVYTIDRYFYNPTILWLYADDFDADYYQAWYGSDYDDNDFLQSPFADPGVFCPTQDLIDLAEASASMAIDQQANFRAGLADLVNQLQQQLANQTGNDVTLSQNDIVITHYQLLDTAVELEGFVSSDLGQFAFKALLDLADPSQDLVFVPVGDPTDDQLDALDAINARIADDGGVIDGQ